MYEAELFLSIASRTRYGATCRQQWSEYMAIMQPASPFHAIHYQSYVMGRHVGEKSVLFAFTIRTQIF
jgi:hypothetical protein